MNPIQESKQELEASIRYAENAIASAKQTIESIAKSQEQTGREQALEQEVVDLNKEVRRQQDLGQGYYDSMMTLKSQVKLLEERIADMSSDMVGDASTIKELNERNDSLSATIQRLKQEQPTMPVIPKAVAIAIFREGLAHGAEAVATEIDNACDICIEESDYVGNFEVSFTKDIDLSDHLDTDWLRGRADEIGETFVLDCLANLCADNKFECRIHGVDDQEEKKND